MEGKNYFNYVFIRLILKQLMNIVNFYALIIILFFRYLPVMKEFTGTASVRLAELEDLFVDMKARVSE